MRPKADPTRRKCRFCGKEPKPPRRTFCGPDCVDGFLARKMRSGGALREILVRRNGARCVLCGLDAAELKRKLESVAEAASYLGLAAQRLEGISEWAPLRYAEDAGELRRLSEAILSEKGFPPATFLERGTLVRSLLEADHILPLVEGGTLDLENLRLLCYPCHLEQTRLLARRRALARREAREPSLFAGEDTKGGAVAPRPVGIPGGRSGLEVTGEAYSRPPAATSEPES